MTSPALKIVNNSGNLIVDRNGKSLNFLGKISAGSGTTTDPWTNTAGKFAGYTSYSLNCYPHIPVLAFADMPLNKICSVTSQTVYSNSIDITVFCNNGTLASNGFDNQQQIDIYVFGLLTSATGKGLKMWNDSGILTHVFTDTDGVPLYPRGRWTESGSSIDLVTTRIMPSLVKPAFCGSPNHDKWTATGTLPNVTTTQWRYGWKWTGGTGLSLAQYRDYQFVDDGGLGTYTEPDSSETIFIEASGL